MSLTNLSNRNDAVGNNSTATYPYGFRVFAAADLLVTVRHPTTGVETTLALTTDYTVTGVGNASGSIVLVDANQAWLNGSSGFLDTDWVLTIQRVVPLTQPSAFRNQGSGHAASYEDAFDRAVMITQQHQDQVDRSIKVPTTVNPAVVNTTLPVPTANSAIRWNGTATGLENFTLASTGAYTFPGGTGILVQTAALTAVARTLIPTPGIGGNLIATRVENGTGVAGNPEVGLNFPVCQGRLSLSSADPAPAADQLNKATIYWLRYKGCLASFWDDANSEWIVQRMSADSSIAVPATTNTVYDVFLRSDGVLVLVAWTNDTTRATALVYQDGIPIQSAATGRPYLGSFRTTGVSGRTEDSAAKRHVWNYWNRVPRHMVVSDANSSWTYTTDTFRQANAAAANQLDFLIGLDEDIITARVHGIAENTAASTDVVVGIGLDSTTVDSATLTMGADMDVANIKDHAMAEYVGRIGAVGRHTLVWLERSNAVGTTTWYGTPNAYNKAGIAGEVMA